MTTIKSESNQRTNLNIAIGVAAFFFVLAVLFGIFWMNTKSKKNTLETEKQEVEQLKATLEKDYYQALSDLEEMRGSNEELNTLIEKQKEELKNQKTQIDGLLRDSRNLGKARREIKALNAKVQQYLAEINQLRQENEELLAQTNILTEEKQALETSLQETQATAEQLSSQNTQLETEREQLQQQSQKLAQKVNIASVVKVSSVAVTGYRTRNNGKLSKKTSAKNIDQLQVCFNTTVNDVAEGGNELFFVRIINPNGETLAIENLGSGVFQNNANGESYRYTKAAEVPYENNVEQICTTWKPGQSFQEGNYKVEVYNKGYLAGTSTFKLR